MTDCLPKPRGALLINASPRPHSTSLMLLKRIQQKTGGEIVFTAKADVSDIVEKMRGAQTIVIGGPCYINSWPSGVIKLMEAAAKLSPFERQNVYGVINGGMPYIHTHRSAIDSLEFFAETVGLSWRGGFVLTGGAMLDGKPLEKHLGAKRVVPAFEIFTERIKRGERSPDSLYIDAQPAPGKIFSRLMAFLLTRSVTKRLKKYGHDPDDSLTF